MCVCQAQVGIAVTRRTVWAVEVGGLLPPASAPALSAPRGDDPGGFALLGAVAAVADDLALVDALRTRIVRIPHVPPRFLALAVVVPLLMVVEVKYLF